MKRTIVEVGLHITVCLVMLLTTASGALAAEQTVSGPDTPAAPNELDDGALEVGVWYVRDYQNCGGWGLGDLTETAPDALGLRDRLIDPFFFFFFPYPTPRWSAPIVWGDGNAWEKDWKRSAAGGWENSQIDQVDFAYFAGHGANSGFFFGVGGNTHDDCQVTKADAQYAWGTLDNDWIGLSACNVLDDPYENYRYWARAMNGTRLLMGFKTVMSDVDYGRAVGWHLRWGNTFTYSWFRSANEKLPTSQIARILAERGDYFNDTWAQHNAPTVVDNTFNIWTHRAGTPIVEAAGAASTQRVDIAALQGAMPIYEVVPLSLAEAEDRFATVGATFGLTNTAIISDVVAASQVTSLYATNDVFVNSDGTFLMDQNGGDISYANPDRLWNEAALVRAADATGMMAVDQESARGFANQFLATTGLLTADTIYATTTQDVMQEVEDPDRQSGVSVASSEPLRILQETTTNYNVEYHRVITYTPQVAIGDAPAQAQVFSVVGPGSTQVVYVATEAPLRAAGEFQLDDVVLGADAGNRQLRPATAVNAAGVMAPLTTPMLPTDTIKLLYAKLGNQVSLDYVDLPGTKEVIDFQPAYYEGEIGLNQDQLHPVYVLTVRNTPLEGNGDPQTYTTNVPVNGSYMRPYAQIVSPADDQPVVPGTVINLQAADSSKTLAELGVDPALTFAMGTGDSDSYLYDWYLNEITPTHKIASGLVTTATLPAVVGSDKPATMRLILVVTDSLSPRDPKIASDELIIAANTVYLPTIGKK